MARNASRLARLSRDPHFIVRTFLIIVIACGVIGLGLSEWRSKHGHRERFALLTQLPTPDREPVEDFLARGSPSPEAVAAMIRHADRLVLLSPAELPEAFRSAGAERDPPSPHEAAIAFSANAGSETAVEILAHYADALYLDGNAFRAALGELETFATGPVPPRFAAECAADILHRHGRTEEAAAHFRKEIDHHPGTAFARARLVAIFLADERGGPILKELLRDRATGRSLDSHTRVQAALAARDLPELAVALHVNRYAEVTPALLAVSLFAGLVWFVILTKLGGVRRLAEPRFAFCLAAVPLGMLSAKATLLAVVLQEHLFGLTENGAFVNDLVFYVSGVGLREESLKLLFVVPLVPFVLKRKSEAEMLAVSACVGLGFAIEENIGYFVGGTGFLGRMITANFLHIALTGAVGLAFFRFCRWPRTRWEEFLGTFLAAVILHGLYDALISLRDLRHLDVLALVLFALIAHRFLQIAKEVREPGFQVISPLGVFVIGCALLTGAVWIYSTWTFPARVAVTLVGNDALGVATLGFLYINHFRNE